MSLVQKLLTRCRSASCALAFCLAAALMLGSVPALAEGVDQLTDTDRRAIRATIQGQIEAFQLGDDERAFSYATPTIQERFGSAARFLSMVRQGYQPVYRPRHVEFTELLDVRGMPTQRLIVIGPENGVFSAYYMMQAQPDGSWRISGVILRPLKDQST